MILSRKLPLNIPTELIVAAYKRMSLKPSGHRVSKDLPKELTIMSYKNLGEPPTSQHQSAVPLITFPT
jgi:hypothetical protein